MFLLIGGIGLAKLSSPTDMDLKCSYSYPEHQVAEGKPLLQFTGSALDEISLTLLIHVDFADPQSMWDQLKTLADNHRPLPLSQGNGLVLGWFVISDLSRVTTVAADDGTLLAIEIRLSLREYVDADQLKTRRSAQVYTAPGRRRSGKKISGITTVEVPKIGDVARSIPYRNVSLARIVRQLF